MEQTEFNMAFSYLGRLNQLFYQADNSAMNLDAHGWFHSLLALYRELSPYIKEEDLKNKKDTISQINHLLSKNNKRAMTNPTNEISTDLYNSLHDFELYIRSVVKSTGLQMRMEQDPSKALQ